MGKIIKNKISYAGAGAEGKSAYQTWLDLGNTGTEQDFLNSLGGKTYTSLAELGLTSDATIEDVVNSLKNGESFLTPVNTFTNYETIFPNKLPNDQWNKIHIIKGTSLVNSHIRCFSQSGTCEYLANINNTNIVSWNDVSGTYIDISDSTIEKLGNEILKYPVGRYRINSTTTGNKFIDLPPDAETKCGLIEVNGTAVGKSPFTDTWVYRMYKFECLTGTSSYIRRLNSGATVGQIELDTGWCEEGQETYTSLSELGLTADATFQDLIDALPKGGSALLGVTEFTNYQTIFPYEERNDQFARVEIQKGESVAHSRIFWWRKDGSRFAIGHINSSNKLGGWWEYALKEKFNGKEVKSVTIDLSASDLQYSSSSGFIDVSLANYVANNTKIIRVEGCYIPPSDNTVFGTYVPVFSGNKSSGIGIGKIYHNGESWRITVAASLSQKGSGFMKLYYID